MKLKKVKEGQKFKVPQSDRDTIWVRTGEEEQCMGGTDEGDVRWYIKIGPDTEVELVDEVTPQSTKEIVQELKKDARLDQWKTAQEIDRIEQEIHRLKFEGINTDQEDKSPMEEYADSVAERRMIEELEARLEEIRNPKPTVDTSNYPDYESLEEIRDELQAIYIETRVEEEWLRKLLQNSIGKLQTSIENGYYIETDGTR